MKPRAWERLGNEFKSIGVLWEPTAVACVAALALVVPKYYLKDNVLIDALNAAGGTALVETAKRLRFDFTLLMQLGLPLVVLYSMRRRFRDFGLGLGNVRLGLRLSGLFVLLYVPAFLVLASNEAFQQHYAPVARRFDSWGEFLLWQIPMIFLVGLRTEFFFRGFIQFGFGRSYGLYAGILAQLIPYVMVHIGKAEMEAVGSLPVGLALAYLAARTGSIWYGLALHGGIALLFNGVMLWQKFHGG